MPFVIESLSIYSKILAVMSDNLANWLAYLFLEPDPEVWMAGFDKMLERWEHDVCWQILREARRHTGDNQRALSRVKYYEGLLLLNSGQWERAEAAYRRSLDLVDDDDFDEMYVIVMNIGLIQRLSGRLDAAIHNHQLCLELAQENEWEEAIAEAHVHLGLDYEMRHDLRLAKTHLLKAKEAYQLMDKPVETARIDNALALVMMGFKRFIIAKDLLLKALSVLEQQEEKLPIAHIYGNLGNIAAHERDYETATAYYSKALEIFQALDAEFETCALLNDLGGMAYYQRDLQRAEVFYKESIERARTLGRVSVERDGLANLALILVSQGQYKAAIAMSQTAIELSRQLGNSRTVAKLTIRKLRWRFLSLWVRRGR